MKKTLAVFSIILSFGLFTTNALSQWTRIYLPLGDTTYSVTALASSNGYTYAGGVTQGGRALLFSSSNNGLAWISTGGQLPKPIVSLAAREGNVYALLQDSGEKYNLMWSSNDGKSWKDISPPHPNGISSSATSFFENGSDLFVGVSGGFGVFVSNDNGLSWMTSGSYGDTSGLYPQSSFFSLYDGDVVLYAGTSEGIYAASFPTDGGGWMPENSGIANLKVNAITEIGTDVFAATNTGLFSSTNGGDNWSGTGLFSGPVNTLATDGKNLFAGESSDNGIIYSSDLGEHWIQINGGLSDSALQTSIKPITISGVYYAYLAAGDGGLWQFPLIELAGVEQADANQSELLQNYPNPFSKSTTINYMLAQEDHVSLSIYNMLGERVAVLKDDMEPAGENEVAFDADALPSGIYCYRLTTTNGGTVTRIMQIER